MKKVLFIVVICIILSIPGYAMDNDQDGMDDEWEISVGLRADINDAQGDADSDGLPNIREYGLGTDPLSGDSDGDGITDKDEVDDEDNPLSQSFFFRIRGWSSIPFIFGILFILAGIYFIIDKERYWLIINKIFFVNQQKVSTLNVQRPVVQNRPIMINRQIPIRRNVKLTHRRIIKK